MLTIDDFDEKMVGIEETILHAICTERVRLFKIFMQFLRGHMCKFGDKDREKQQKALEDIK